jgi:phage-related protein
MCGEVEQRHTHFGKVDSRRTREAHRCKDLLGGDSYDVLLSWPKAMRLDFGHALREMQNGRTANLQVRPMPSIGPSVYELKDSDDKAWYRVMYLARKNNVIHVLDCFEKNVAKTQKKDIKTAAARLSLVKQRLMEEQKNAKHKAEK